jgi:hypothetical protein
MARKKNPINDIVNQVGGWLGGRGPGTNPQVQAAMQATRAIARTADTATGGFGQALLSDAQRMAQTGSSTPSALYKTAAVNLGAAAAGVGAAKVAGKAVQSGRVVNPVKAVKNLVKGEKVVVHGTYRNIQGNQLIPSSRSIGAQEMNKSVVFSLDPRQSGASKHVSRAAHEYANIAYNNTQPQIVIGKAPKSNLSKWKDVQVGKGKVDYIVSEQPIDVARVIKADKPLKEVSKDLRRALRQEGVSMRQNVPIQDKLEQMRIARMRKKYTKNAPRS